MKRKLKITFSIFGLSTLLLFYQNFSGDLDLSNNSLSNNPQNLTSTEILKELGSKHKIKIGTAIRYSPMAQEADQGAYIDTILTHYNLVTLENEMKFDINTRPSSTIFNFDKANAMVEFARNNNIKVHGHTLVWSNKTVLPLWFKNLSSDSTSSESSKKLSAMRNHIRTTINHFKTNYPGVVISWDVVNEAVGSGGGVRNSTDDPYSIIGNSTDRTDYIFHAFKEASSTDPNALLFYNDYGFEIKGIKQDGIFNIISKLKAKGMPIHGIGLQGHFKNDPNVHLPTVAELRSTIKRFASIGIKFRFTEIDVRMNTTDGITSEENIRRNQYYYNVVRACVLEPNCDAVSSWGFNEAHSWIEGQNDNPGQPAYGYSPSLPFSKNYTKTAAFNQMVRALTVP